MSSPPHSSNPPPSDRRWAQTTAQALIQWMPLGGSGWVFVTFLMHQEWVQAIVMFPITVIAVIWGAYTGNFLARIREIYGDRGKKDADSLMGWMDGVDQAIRWQLSGFEDKYLRCQAADCRRDQTEGYEPTELLRSELTEVFVPLRIETQWGRRFDGTFPEGMVPNPGYW